MDYEVPRCKSCGEALIISDPDAPYIVCRSCGNQNVRSDGLAAAEQIKAEVMTWVRKAMPAGMSITQIENVDQIARHNIFINSVRPNIESEFRDYRFGMINVMSNQLIVMPFRSLTSIVVKHDPKALFTFNAKVKHMEVLAVDDESKALVKLSTGLTHAYALMINNVNLMRENTPGRYGFMSNNFKAAAESLEGLTEYEILKERMEALSVLSEGIGEVIDNKCIVAVDKLKNALSALAKVKEKASGNLDFGSMGTAISKEEVIGKAILSIAEAINRAPELESGTVLVVLSNFIAELDRQEKTSSAKWDIQMKRPERYTDLFTLITKAIGSKAALETIKVVKGSGSFLVPFWVMEIKYSFVTGSMFSKKAVDVSENVLLSAVFTTDKGAMENPSSGITDIFKSRPETKFLDGFKGKETSISMGGGVKNLIDSAQEGYSNNMKIVLPISTRQEAELKCNDYLAACQNSHPKLKMGKAVAKELIYIPCNINGAIKVVPDLSPMSPENNGNAETVKKISI